MGPNIVLNVYLCNKMGMRDSSLHYGADLLYTVGVSVTTLVRGIMINILVVTQRSQTQM